MSQLRRDAKDFDKGPEKPKPYQPSANARLLADTLDVTLKDQGEKLDRIIARHGMGPIDRWLRETLAKERRHEVHASQLWDMFVEQFPDTRLV